MTSVTAQQQSTQVARPLSVLVPLIKDDLQHGADAAKTASEPYYRAAGEKMNEAKSQMGSGEFAKWVERNFSITVRQALFYMAFTKTDTANHFSSMRDFRSRGLGHNVGTVAKKDWHEPVKESIERAKREAARIEEENLSRKREREEKIKLCLRMLDIGYKILSKELHPDKGGSRDAMARLNEARNYAKAALA